MPQHIDLETKHLFFSRDFRPGITTWNRLEGRPRGEEFYRSLRAEVRDPLWMLCRQWQFGEFQGEDGGSAIKSKVQVTLARINRYAGRSGRATGYDDHLPLEARVEREPIYFDLMTRAQMGRHWLKLLERIGNHRALYLEEYGFRDVDDVDNSPASREKKAQLQSDQKAWQTLKALRGRAVDGEKLLAAIHSDAHENWLVAVVADTGERQKILEAAELFQQWFDRVYSQPTSLDDPAWADPYLEYQFACATPADEAGEKQTVLIADQYHQGHLDWYAFNTNADPEARLPDKEGAEIPPVTLKVEEPISFVPNAIEFGGMPNVRWWEFEDRKTDFGNLRPSTSDLATLMLAEFGLIYGNDWSLVPYTLEVGTLCEVLGVVVTDVFGVHTLVRVAADTTGANRERWGLYNLSTSRADQVDTRLFLPPATIRIQESAPLEQVILTRDEMANMVWGIERTIPGLAGGGVDGDEAATDLEAHLLAQTTSPTTTGRIDTGAAIRYRLGTRVSENWIPFIAVHNPGSNREIRLQRAAMPRLIPGAVRRVVEPRGVILRPGLDEETQRQYFINEEEVPRAGVMVTRSYQRTRWWDGRIYTWLGRRKQTGRGQGSSGLEFDRIVPVDHDRA